MQCGAGAKELFSVKVGLNQGSVMSPVLFAFIVDTISEGARRRRPLSQYLLVADNLAIVVASEEELQERVVL